MYNNDVKQTHSYCNIYANILNKSCWYNYTMLIK